MPLGPCRPRGVIKLAPDESPGGRACRRPGASGLAGRIRSIRQGIRVHDGTRDRPVTFLQPLSSRTRGPDGRERARRHLHGQSEVGERCIVELRSDRWSASCRPNRRGIRSLRATQGSTSSPCLPDETRRPLERLRRRPCWPGLSSKPYRDLAAGGTV